jgi:type VI secretion system ImpA family protein
VWINEKLAVQVRLIPLAEPYAEDAKTFCWADWEAACRTPNAEVSQPNSFLAAIRQSVMLTANEFYAGLQADVEGCAEACAGLQSILETHCGAETPSLGNLLRSITAVRDFLAPVLAQRPAPASVVSAGQPEAGGRSQEFQSGPSLPGAYREPIRSRAEAYQRLAEAADYLATTEPHSPAPYLVRRAIKWGSMQLKELLPELVRSDAELADICRLLQIPER